mmetsp:Transcript_45069/g.119082  ORF Transcript_45069/g.119082 Transcript_45069/m.119082 type:complete len:203 (+) Transcript_45069:842-1450(+)
MRRDRRGGAQSRPSGAAEADRRHEAQKQGPLACAERLPQGAQDVRGARVLEHAGRRGSAGEHRRRARGAAQPGPEQRAARGARRRARPVGRLHGGAPYPRADLHAGVARRREAVGEHRYCAPRANGPRQSREGQGESREGQGGPGEGEADLRGDGHPGHPHGRQNHVDPGRRVRRDGIVGPGLERVRAGSSDPREVQKEREA